MSVATDALLTDLLHLRHGATDILNNRESTRLEFKQSFSFANQASYARTMISFANDHGGFIVFGVEDRPHRLVGVDLERFVKFDPAPLTSFLGAHVVPLVEWEFGSIEFAGYPLGYICTEPSADKPVMVAATSGDELKEGDIYYRYSGQTRVVRYAELKAMLDEKLERERRAWMSHMEHINRAGPSNVGILDTVRGEMYGGDTTFLIDEALTEKLRFIRKGQFNESGGDPTLRLVGDLHEISSVVSPIQVPTGIHMTDLIGAAIADQDLPTQAARSYLRETADQNSPMSPLFRFARLAGFDKKDAAEWLRDAPTSYATTRKRVVDRLLGTETIAPTGTPPTELPMDVPGGVEELIEAIRSTRVPAEQRGMLVAALHKEPATVIAGIGDLPVTRLCEALMHIDSETLSDDREDMWKVLRSMLELGMDGMEAGERSIFRRCVAFLDQQMYSY